MAKKFFTNVSPKAVMGIRRAFAHTGADVSVLFDPARGDATVVVSDSDDARPAAGSADGGVQRRGRDRAAA